MASRFNVKIQAFADELQAIKAVRALDPDLDLKEAKDLVEAYGVVATGVSQQRAEEIQAALVEARCQAVR
jgi:ribosomal protein L7/L12